MGKRDRAEKPEKSQKKRIKRRVFYDAGMPALAEKFCLLGATDEELALHLGCALGTLYSWQHQHPEFREAIKKGKKPADANVAHALYHRAIGAEWVEEVAIKLKDVEYQDGHRVEHERVEVVSLQKAAPPDTTACIFYLKNRDSHWNDKGTGDMDAIARENRARYDQLFGAYGGIPT